MPVLFRKHGFIHIHVDEAVCKTFSFILNLYYVNMHGIK